MGDSSNRRDDYHLPSIRALTGAGTSQSSRPNTDSMAQQQQSPTQQTHQSPYPAQPPAHENHLHYSQTHPHSRPPRLGSPRHSHAPAQSKAQSHPYGYHYQHQHHQNQHISAHSGYDNSQSHHHPPPYAQRFDPQRAGNRPPHVESPVYAEHPAHPAYPQPAGFRAPPSHDARYEGSQSLPTGSDYYIQQQQYRAPYTADHSLASARDRPAEMPGVRTHSLHHQQHASTLQYHQQPGSSSQYPPQYSQYPQPATSHHPQYYHNTQDPRMQPAHSPDYRHGMSPSSYSGYSAASTPRSAGIRDDAYAAERKPMLPATTAHPLPPPAPRQRPPSSRPDDPRVLDNELARAPRPRTTEPRAQPQPASAASNNRTAASNPPEADGKSDDEPGKDADEALIKRRKRNAQSAARLRERRKTRENELSNSCSKLEMQISRLEEDLSEEKQRALAELKGSQDRSELSSRGPETEAGSDCPGRSTDSAVAGMKRQRSTLMDCGSDIAMNECDDDANPRAEGAKRIRPLRELDQVRLGDLKSKIETLGKLNQQVCVNLGVLRKEIERISEAIILQRACPEAQQA